MSKELFAIFGDPVAHSKSPLIQNNSFKKLDYPACYGRYHLTEGSKLKETFLTLGLKGANITVPHKQEAYSVCDVLDDFAQKVGAVNTIVKKEGKLYGYNTDAPGFLKAISNFKESKKVLFLGAGGTAQSSATILREAGYEVTILNRSKGRLTYFKEEGFQTATFETFTPTPYDLLVNMTSAGLEDNHFPAPQPLLEALMQQTKGCIDVIYGKETPFLKLAKSHNLPTKDGSNMLIYQGAIACEYFTEGKLTFADIVPPMQQALFEFH
jgi:shikimate dehydrogenase